jgi:hypothetical protein
MPVPASNDRLKPSAPRPPRRHRRRQRPQKPRCAITDGLQVFVTHKIASGIKPATICPYRTFKKQLGGFAAQRGYQMIDEFTALDIDLFWATSARARRATA